jgi:3-oxoacyl-[acyl-carrier-protein] synthase-3
MTERYGNIVGWGKYVPEKVITNFDLEKMIDTSNEWIVQRSGIHERHVVNEDEQISEMATAAGRQALKMAGIRPRDLDLIIVATSSPDYLTPPISSQVQHALGAKNVGAFTLVTGCTGFVYSLVTAQQFIAAGTCDKVLVIGAELITRFVDYTDRTTCILFVDGAGAVVMESTEKKTGVLSYTLGSDGSKSDALILPGGGSKNPPSLEMLEQKMQYVHMNGNEVFKFATRILGKSLRKVIKDANLTPEDIDLFIPHQANKRIILSAARQARLPEEKVFINIHKYGNTSAASIPIALCEALDEGRAKIGDTLAFVAFGAGVTWATAIIKLIERDIPKKTRKWRVPFLNWFSRKKETVVSSPE